MHFNEFICLLLFQGIIMVNNIVWSIKIYIMIKFCGGNGLEIGVQEKKE